MTVYIGVDIGGTKIAASIVDSTGKVLDKARRETPAQDVAAIANAVAEVAAELQAKSSGRTIGGIGVACAGFVDADGEAVVFAPNLAWRDEPLAQRLRDATGLPVTLDNDANAAAWGEFKFGAAREAKDTVMVTLGTGVGGGIVSQDQLTRGAHGMAAEIGHLRVVPDGRRCGCGNRGCWEQYASGTALVREAREMVAAQSPHAAELSALCGGDPQALNGTMITTAAKAGDQASIELLEDIGRWAGEGMASLAAVLDPDMFVIGGGVSAAGDLVLEPARAAFARQLTARGHRPMPPMVIAALGNDAGMIGAADLAAVRFGQ